eukprot:TRINITY_DN22318_c0_g1_i1.p1 TRINITY_DN22318_c0_g1~~TRINITY_DN22318_c0_g1_i1.p1  ORF type:complete len:339 (+),score=53.13 TRINITY_DN22318_c0_g1_i1:101-1117(+)
MNDQTIGYFCCLVSVLGFGSNYIPVKKVDVKDGVFFTLWLTVGIFLVGLAQWCFTGFYKFEPFAMLGGAIWAIANTCVPFIIARCGLGSGQLVWSVTNMLTGWATGTFGLFGKNRDVMQYETMNYLGVGVAMLSLVPFALMQEEKPPAQTQDNIPLSCGTDDEPQHKPAPKGGFASGFVVALLAGVLMGSNFDPPTYLQQQGQAAVDAGLPPPYSPHAMDYVISHFAGILLTTLVYFGGYLVVTKKENRFIGQTVVLPGVVSGILWGLAQVAWFKSNAVLSYAIAFPITVAVPGVLAVLWGCLLFGENKGPRNMSLLGAVILLQAVGVGLIAVSKGDA